MKTRPTDIDTSRYLLGSLHIVAQHILWAIVMIAQTTGDWVPFTAQDIKRYCLESDRLVTHFLNDFLERGWLLKEGESYTITEALLDHCMSTPQKR